MAKSQSRPRVRFDELAVFVEVAAAGSLAGAARRLGLPKSTIGRAIARVERDYGVALVRRMARGQALTESGRRLANLASSHVAALRDLASALASDAAEPYGTLRVTAPSDIGTLVLGPLIAEFVALHPRVRIELEVTIRVIDLVREGFDLAVRMAMRRLPSSSLVAKKLARVELGLFAAASYVARRGVPKRPEDLAAHDHVLIKGQRGRQMLSLEPPPSRRESAAKGPLTVNVEGRCSANDFFFVREAIAAGAGIGPLPWFIARGELAAGRLVRILPDYGVTGTTAYLVHASANPLPTTLQAFRSFVLERGPRLLV